MKILPAGLTACDENNMSHAMVLPVPADLTACRTYATSIRQLAKLAQSVRTDCTGKHHDTHHIARRQVCGQLTACRTYATSIRELAKLAQSVRTDCTGKHHDTH